MGMKSDFLIAVTQLASERGLPKESVLTAVEAALASAYRKDPYAAGHDITVKLNPNDGEIQTYALKTVVEEVNDSRIEILLETCLEKKIEGSLGQVVEVPATFPAASGRIAAQTAKQVVLQRLREAERELVLSEYIDRQGEIISGRIERIESHRILVNLGRAEASMPVSEQTVTERYRPNLTLQFYLLEIAESARGPELILSRSHPNLVRRLFEREVPEIFKGSVEICAISREPGGRTKVAVTSRQEGVDPVGSCVGLRGLRIQNIVNELQGERIDVIQWDSDISVLLANALRPAKVIQVELSENDHLATVVVPDDHFSLAIGKDGQNVRLAAKLTGLRIDLKGASELASAKVAEEGLGVSGNDELQGSIESIEDQANSKMLHLENEIDNEIAVTVEGLEAVVQDPIETTVVSPLTNEVNDLGISAEEALLAQEDEEDSPHNENFNDRESGNAGSPSMDDEKVWAIPGIHREPSVLRFREDIMPQRTPDGRDDKGKGRSKRSRRSRTNEPETASG
jgi:N utilization substance protein A